MYFNASERIALNTTTPRSTIEQIDAFLAQPDVKRFEPRQLQEKTHLNMDLSPLLQAYVQEGILKTEESYLCPEHGISLRVTRKRVGECDDCGKGYPLEDCDRKFIYERVREPDFPVEKSTTYSIREINREDKPWWKDSRFIIPLVATVILGILGLFATVLSGDTINIYYPTPQITPEISVTAPIAVITPDITDEVEVTLEVTSEN